MNIKHKKENLIIVGAGLSGLYTAFLLQDKYNITILEARERIGGRVLSIDGLDLGPSWVWPDHTNILKLIKDFKLELIEQYNNGYAIYDDKTEAQKFTAQKAAPSFRVKGGMHKIIEKLENILKENSNVKIHLEEEVEEVEYTNSTLSIKTNENSYQCDKIVFTIPPRLVTQDISFNPPIALSSINKLNDIATWMGHTAKATISFEKNFWIEKGLSGFIFSNIGPLMEVHDSSYKDNAALIGFFHSKAKIEKESIKKQIKRIFHLDDKYIKNIYSIDWREEKYTSSLKDKDVNMKYFSYGYDLSLFDEKVDFAGTESSYENGGYLEGALLSAIKISNKLL